MSDCLLFSSKQEILVKSNLLPHLEIFFFAYLMKIWKSGKNLDFYLCVNLKNILLLVFVLSRPTKVSILV